MLLLTSYCREHLQKKNAVWWKRLRVSNNFEINKPSGNLLCHEVSRYTALFHCHFNGRFELWRMFEVQRHVGYLTASFFVTGVTFHFYSAYYIVMSTRTAAYRMFLRLTRDKWSTEGTGRSSCPSYPMYPIYRVSLLSPNVLQGVSRL